MAYHRRTAAIPIVTDGKVGPTLGQSFTML
jgi:hypothetical protein